MANAAAQVLLLDGTKKVPVKNVPKAVARNAVGLMGHPQTDAPQFVRANGGNPVFTVAAQNPAADATAPTTPTSLYWPYVVDARAALGSAALDEFYLYYSTDHGSGGVWLATGPTELGPWTGRGQKYKDSVSGIQCETPSVIWVPEEGLFFMYYQMAGVAGAVGVQTTLLATSPDGLTWTRIGPVVDLIAGHTWGDGHTGYFKPFRVGRQWFAYHLFGGGNYPQFALSRSHDGRSWVTDSMPLYHSRDMFTDGRRLEWNSQDVVRWRGQLTLVGIASNYVSGDVAKDGRIMTAALSTNLRQPIGLVDYQLYPVTASESTNYRSTLAFTGRDGRLYLYYQCGNAFFAAVAD